MKTSYFLFFKIKDKKQFLITKHVFPNKFYLLNRVFLCYKWLDSYFWLTIFNKGMFFYKQYENFMSNNFYLFSQIKFYLENPNIKNGLF